MGRALAQTATFAVILNGYPRAPVDVDVLVADSPENLRRLLECRSGWGEAWARELKVGDFVPQEGAIRVMEELDLDIFTRVLGRTLADFRPRLRHLDAGAVRIPCLGPEDLLLLKQASCEQRTNSTWWR